jgi:ParB/RepB/Spo0J family partition protein
MDKIKTEYIDINQLKSPEYNPRKADEKQYDDLKESIEEFGLVDPLIVNSAENRKGIIIGGNFRYRIAKDMGIKEVPVVFVDIPDLEKEQELNLRLNKNTGEWDWGLLANFDEDLLENVGFKNIKENIFHLEEDIEQPEFDENIDTVNKCPKCGYEW